MRCGASRPGWRRRPRHCGADKVCCAPIGPLRRASATVSWRHRWRWPRCMRQCAPRPSPRAWNRRRYRGCSFPWPSTASVFLPSWSMPPPSRSACRLPARPLPSGQDQAARSFFEDLLRRGRLKVARPASQRPKSYAPPRRSPAKPIPTNCGAKDGRWCCDGFASTAGVGTVENTLLGPI